MPVVTRIHLFSPIVHIRILRGFSVGKTRVMSTKYHRCACGLRTRTLVDADPQNCFWIRGLINSGSVNVIDESLRTRTGADSVPL